ncbi:hypothetical protein J5N97_029725 [Dioscorea zingiberensis]|uniref:Uncharacterized protein n=1 Tax=Dioscorea zingiberensis TaxID=325984 RepID=A0A9D5BVX4_9LILI|nr:hypothetical protein J5N97_029725 [Dioscorea zingiberensis]
MVIQMATTSNNGTVQLTLYIRSESHDLSSTRRSSLEPSDNDRMVTKTPGSSSTTHSTTFPSIPSSLHFLELSLFSSFR